MLKFRKILIDNKIEWQEIISKSYNYDFYHTSLYNELEHIGTPFLLVAYLDKDFIALPLVERTIDGTDYNDCTSVYGYPGPISSVSIDDLQGSLVDFFQENIKSYFQENNIVSVFSRLHPITNNYKFFQGIGEIVDLNKTIAINLTLTLQEQRRQYRKSNKYEINKLKKEGFIVHEAETQKEIDEFIGIYYETMRKVNADDYYFFSREYFYKFLKGQCFQAKLLLAKKNEIITSGAIFTITNKIMQYHLAGTRQEYSKNTPMKLILDEARLLGNKLEIEYLHLGGGVGGSDEDPLFRFKSGFTKETFQYRIWKYIVDPKKYDGLVRKKGIKQNSSFFPLYRLK